MRNNLPQKESIDPESLEWRLECAVVTGWKELSNNHATPERIHIEYIANKIGRLDSLKLWASPRRGQWDLVCDYRTRGDQSDFAGITFSNGFLSKNLESSLETIFQHQEHFAPLLRLPQGMIQVQPPTADAVTAAERAFTMPSADRQE